LRQGRRHESLLLAFPVRGHGDLGQGKGSRGGAYAADARPGDPRRRARAGRARSGGRAGPRDRRGGVDRESAGPEGADAAAANLRSLALALLDDLVRRRRRQVAVLVGPSGLAAGEQVLDELLLGALLLVLVLAHGTSVLEPWPQSTQRLTRTSWPRSRTTSCVLSARGASTAAPATA